MWYNLIITKNPIPTKKRKITMINYNTLGNSLKRDLYNFSQKVSKNLSKPDQKFIANMIYGINSSKSCTITEIGRSLNEKITPKKTFERLYRNLKNFSNIDVLMENYKNVIKKSIGSNAMLILDPSDITKKCSEKMENIGIVKDGSTGKFQNGYWTMGIVALSENQYQPLPVYNKVYPCVKMGGVGTKTEVQLALKYLSENFDKNIPRIMDRGLDSGDYMLYFDKNDEKFILRVSQTKRVVIHNNKKCNIESVANDLVCSHVIKYKNKHGNNLDCHIGTTDIVFPNVKDLKLKLVVCKGYGKPLLLLTNLEETVEELAVRVVKAYLMRWRIDEFYGFKKQSLQYEKFRVRSFNAIQTLDLLLTIATGYIGVLCDKLDETIIVNQLILVSKRNKNINKFLLKTKFLFYAILDGISAIFSRLNTGIASLFSISRRDPQLCFPRC